MRSIGAQGINTLRIWDFGLRIGRISKVARLPHEIIGGGQGLRIGEFVFRIV
jgi:hypothetical protein